MGSVSKQARVSRRLSTVLFVLTVLTVCPYQAVAAQTQTNSESLDFAAQVAPLLERHCLRCHGADKAKGGLRLDTAAHLQRGGDSGAVVDSDNAAESELLLRIKSEDTDARMPQAGDPLSKQEITLLERWLRGGADWPNNLVLVGDLVQDDQDDQAGQHWAFQPVRRVSVPENIEPDARWGGHGIDAFILRRLRHENLEPSPQTDRVTLIRRATLDLIGLPPTPVEVRSFVNDNRPGAYARLVERLLASPHYGEKWARPWLDLCHYAESDGYLTDQLRPVAWRYRQWLVGALNRNLPFDQFTIEQLAGDLLPAATIEQRIATGFLRQTLSNREGGADLEEFRVKQVVDRTTMVGSIWLGLTVGCARCHDHKYDPLAQREFFELYACLNNADEVNRDAPLPAQRAAFLASRQKYERSRRELMAPLKPEVHKLQRRWEAKLLHAYRHPGENHSWDRQWELLGLVWGGGLGEGQLEGTEIVKLAWEKRTERQQDDLLDYFLPRGSIVDPDRFEELKLAELNKELVALKKTLPPATRAPTMQAALTRRPTYIQERGDFRARGADVHPATPDCLPPWSPASELPRLALARWLVSTENPLSARVTVNRMWQEFFGRGLVLTSEDFGKRGDRPSHPDLLDWLATQFMEADWDVKAMHRLIVTSATYRQSSAPRAELTTLDPANVLLARQASLRLPAEAVRDLGLAASGLICTTIGGTSVKPPQPERVTMEAFGYNKWEVSAGENRYRRALYTVVLRASPFAQFATFDAPNPNEVCTRRVRSNTPLQALTLLNDPVFFEMAQALAARVLRQRPATEEELIEYAFQLCCARAPSQPELRRLHQYLRQQLSALAHTDAANNDLFDKDVSAATAAGWTNLCSVLLNLHEFITRD